MATRKRDLKEILKSVHHDAVGRTSQEALAEVFSQEVESQKNINPKLRRDTVETRDKIMRAAEQLFFANGVDAVSMLDIKRAAGQQNNSVIQYHFKDKRGLIDAIVLRHSIHIHDYWEARMNEVENRTDMQQEIQLVDMIDIFVHGIANKLDDADGGKAYISISAQLIGHPTMPLYAVSASLREAPMRLMLRIHELAKTKAELLYLRSNHVLNLTFNALESRARAEHAGIEDASTRSLLLSDLSDAIAAVLSAPPSPRTAALLV